ncbi:MAG: alpha-ketoglutarate-dependent dioxygenase AlkB family protein [Alphaproteobacteria bacterium]
MANIVKIGTDGATFHPGYLDLATQTQLLSAVVAGLRQAPLFVPRMPRTGRPFSVTMSNFGPLGWVSDQAGGYRYQKTHPTTGQPWPVVPEILRDIWADLGGDAPFEACLVNYYQPGTKMGLHQDRDEHDFSAPVVSVSLGDTAIFRLGGTTRKGKTTALRLASGDLVVLGGAARLAFHGVDRIIGESSTLLDAYPELFPKGGRINLTLRRVN